MSLTFFWRCEDVNLDGTHDFSAGDTSATATNTPAINTTAVRYGTNGAFFDSGSDRYSFTPTSIISNTAGAAGLWFQFPTAFPASGGAYIFYAQGTNFNDYIRVETLTGLGASNRGLRLSIRNNGGAAATLDLTDNELAPGNWYFLAFAWDSVAPSRRITVYDTSMSVLEDRTSTAAFTAPVDITNWVFGDITGSTGTMYIDNVFAASLAADIDILIDNSTITSYTLFDDGGGGGSATISNTSPQDIALTVNGRAVTVNTFTSVAIMEVLINEAGSPVSNRTGISLLVWYGGAPVGAPDASYSALTTDANGTTSWSLAPGGLTYNQTIFYVATDGGASLSMYTCARMIPTYQ